MRSPLRSRPTSPPSRPRAVPRRFGRDRAGTSAVEFACVLPIFLAILIGGNEFVRATSVSRKVATLTRTVADLATQYTTMSETDVSTVLNASAQVMSPFTTSALTIVLSEISTDALGISTVTWSRSLNGTALRAGSPYVLPLGFAVPGTSLVLSSVTFTYVPVFGAAYMPSKVMSDHLYMLPRRSTTVDIAS